MWLPLTLTNRHERAGREIVIAWHKDLGLTISRLRLYDQTAVLVPENSSMRLSTITAKQPWKIVATVLVVDRQSAVSSKPNYPALGCVVSVISKKPRITTNSKRITKRPNADVAGFHSNSASCQLRCQVCQFGWDHPEPARWESLVFCTQAKPQKF